MSGLGNAGGRQAQQFPVTQWASTLVFWVIFLFAIVASLNALNLTAVSTPLNAFLDQIFIYLPKVGGVYHGWAVFVMKCCSGRLEIRRRFEVYSQMRMFASGLSFPRCS